jgi:hypothetical protein
MFKYSVQTPQGKKMIKECGRASCACFEKYVYAKRLPMREYLDYKKCRERNTYPDSVHTEKHDPTYPFLL